MEVLSRNPYDLLGDDEGGEAPAVKASAPAKKDEKKAAPASAAPAKRDNQNKRTDRPPRNEYRPRGGLQSRGGAEAGARPPRQFREPRGDNADYENVREQRNNDGERRAERGGNFRGRGGRGGRGGFRGREFDRHSGSGRVDGYKKEVAGAGSWGNPLTAEEDAKKDTDVTEEGATEKVEGAETPVEATEETPKEPEESFKTLEQYFSEKAKPATETNLRKANEGSDDSQWKNAVLLKKEDEEEQLFADLAKPGKKGKASKEKAQKTFVNIDQRFADEGRGNFGGRGGRGRGEFRGGRGGDRGARGRGGRSAQVSIEDQSAFPSLK